MSALSFVSTDLGGVESVVRSSKAVYGRGLRVRAKVQKVLDS